MTIANFGAPQIAFNQAARDFFGIDPGAERFFIKEYYRLAHRDELEQGFANLMDGQSAQLELELRKANGTWVPATLHAHPKPPGQSPTVGAVVTVIPSRAQAPAYTPKPTPATGSPSVAQLRKLQELLWNSEDIGVSVTDDYATDGLSWNPTMYALLGLDPAEVAPSSQAYFDCVHPDDRPMLEALGERLRRGEVDAWQREYRLLNARGEIIWVSGRVLAGVDDEGRLALASLIVSVDALRRSASDATAARLDLEQMTYTISHDLRAPVRHLESFCGLMMESIGPQLEGDEALYLKYAKESIDKLGAMIQALVEYSRLPRAIPAPKRVDLGAVARRLLRGNFAGDAGRVVVEALPQVTGDEQLLERLLCHLIDNALKFSRGRADDRIQLRGSIRDGDFAVVVITDHGVGFDERYADKLFRMFQRLHGANEFPGFGTGLTIADRIAKLHGGTITGASAEGTTTFTLELPIPRRGPTTSSAAPQ